MPDANGQSDTISGMHAITISREYGSGGGEIAARLAKHLGWRLVDHEVVFQVTRAVGVSEAEATEHDEHAAPCPPSSLAPARACPPIPNRPATSSCPQQTLRP